MNRFLTLLMILCLGLWSSGPLYAKPYDIKVLEGCEGEGCGITNETRSNKSFVLYQEMDRSSKILGKFKSGTKATNLGAKTLVLALGKYRISAIKDESLGLKVGDIIDTVFSEGEGYYTANFKGKSIDFNEESFELEVIEPTKLETWFYVKVGKVSGYSSVFPFLGSLE